MLEERASLIDLGDYPEIHADNIGDYQELCGGRCRFVLYGWYKMDGVWRPKVTGLLTRPVETMTMEQIAYWRAFRPSLPTFEPGMLMMH